MKIIFLTHAEAADPAVVANVRDILSESCDTDLSDVRIEGRVSQPIGIDAPDVGLPPASDVFTSTLPAPQLPPGAPSSVGAGQLPTAPVAPMPGQIAPTAPPAPVPQAVPVAPAPLAPAAPASPAGAVETDTDGLPWDARIHSGSKGKNKDGRWTAKRGLNDGAYVASVQAELRALMGVPAAPPVPVAPAPVPQAVPVAPPAPAPVPAAPQGETFAQFMVRLAPYTSSGQITPDHLAAVGAQVGATLVQLQQRPDLIPAFAQALGI